MGERLGGEQQGRGPRRTALPRGSVSGFMVMGLVSGLSLADHCDLGSFLVAHTLLMMDASAKDSGRWSDTPCLLLTFPEFFRLVVAY